VRKYAYRMKQNVFISIGFIFSYKVIVIIMYRGVLREGKRGTCLGPPFATIKCKVAYFAFKGAQ